MECVYRCHLSGLNLRLQGATQTVLDMLETWKAFVGKLGVFSDDIYTSTFHYVRHMREFYSHRKISTTEIIMYICELEAEFTMRFVDFKSTAADLIEQLNSLGDEVCRAQKTVRSHTSARSQSPHSHLLGICT